MDDTDLVRCEAGSSNPPLDIGLTGSGPRGDEGSISVEGTMTMTTDAEFLPLMTAEMNRTGIETL